MNMPVATPAQPEQLGVVTLSEESMAQLALMIEKKVDQSLEKKLNEQTAEIFWNAGLKMLRREAGDRALKVGWWGFKQLAGKALLFVVVGWLVYAVGGWEGLTRLLKLLFGKELS